MKDMRVKGDICANGQPLGRDIAHIASYIQQEDLFIGTLTVRETLLFQVSHLFHLCHNSVMTSRAAWSRQLDCERLRHAFNLVFTIIILWNQKWMRLQQLPSFKSNILNLFNTRKYPRPRGNKTMIP